MNGNQRDRAIDAVDVLNDLIGDLVTGTMVLREQDIHFKKRALTLDQMVGVQKMCLSHLVLALAKCIEFWEKYHDLMPAEHKDAFKLMNRRIRAREVISFRNSCVGHLWHDKEQRCLKHSEVMTLLSEVIGDDIGTFLAWLNDPMANDYPNTVVSIVQEVRNDIAQEYGIQPEDVIDR